jgi:uncharacterized membrane protein
MVKSTDQLRNIFKNLFFLFLGIFVVLCLIDYELVALCNNPYSRSENPDSTKNALIPRWVRDLFGFGITRFVLIGFAARIVSLSQEKGKAFLGIIALFASYFPQIWLIEEIFKPTLNDKECNTKHNSISGHTFFSVWVSLISLYFYFIQIRQHSKAHKQALQILTIICVLCASQTIFYTYYYGYHTLQQVFLGGILGLLSVDVTVYFHYAYSKNLLPPL